MESSPTAPPVVAVVVTCDPGPWFDEALSSLARQDYANLSVLVVDSASILDPTGRVAAALPDAFVQRLSRRVEFGVAANEVLTLVDGASFYLLCHDDVALEPNAVSLMVEEAFRSNAGMITPKLVEWERPDHILAVGVGADRQGIFHPLVEPGELDQQQHDSVRDVFVAPSGATLVRSDLFASLHGYSAQIAQFGEDLDLSWRVHLAGARVVAVPAARVRHLEAQSNGRRGSRMSLGARRRADELAETHRLRTVLTCYGPLRLVTFLPLLVFYLLGEALWALVRGHAGQAGAVLRAATRSVADPKALFATRRQNQRNRRSSDRELAELQMTGNVRLRSYARELFEGGASAGLPVAETAAGGPALAGGGTRFGAPSPSPSPSIGGGTWRLALGCAAVLAIVVLFGSRSLLGHDLPGIAQLPVTAGGPGRWWHAWWANTGRGGLGGSLVASPGLVLLALAGWIMLGALGALQHVVVLGPLLMGPLGAYWAARWWGSRKGQVAAMAAYAIVPVPYNALAAGRWGALLVYAAAPWTIGVIARLSSLVPYPHSLGGRLTGRIVGLGLLTAVVGAFAPSWLIVVPMLGLGLCAGSVLAGGSQGAIGPAALRLIGVSAAAALIAVLLLEPWSLRVIGHGPDTFAAFGGRSARLGLGEVLRFDTGPVGGIAGWGLLIAAGLPLVIGRSWRLAWAARLWLVALTCFAVVWAGLRGWLPLPDPEVVLAPAAAALAAAAALGMAAFELDLPGYRFGWRQAASAVAAAALAASALPFLVASGDGAWRLPSADASTALGFLSGEPAANYRVLWVGAPGSLPLGSRPFSTVIGYATSFNGAPDVTYLWASSQVGPVGKLAEDLRLASQRRTTTLGSMLAPLTVRYIVIPNSTGPSGSGGISVPVPSQLLAGLSMQTDLVSVSPDRSYTVYVNAAWHSSPSPKLHSSGLVRLLELLEIAGWILAVAMIVVDRRRRALAKDPEAVRPEWFTPISPVRGRDFRRFETSPATPSDEATGGGEEVWVNE